MSLMPFFNHPLFRTGDWWDSSTLGRLFDQNFASDLLEDDPLLRTGAVSNYYPYWMRSRAAPLVSSLERGLSEVRNDENRFVVNLDISHFSPEEIKVKVVDNNLMVEGKHEEKMDQHGFVSRSFSRRYMLPKDVDQAKLTSNLTASGVLHIEAPKESAKKTNERSIPIQFGAGPKAVEQANKGEHKK